MRFHLRRAAFKAAVVALFASLVFVPTTVLADQLSADAAKTAFLAAQANIASLQASLTADNAKLQDARLLQATAADGVAASEQADTSAKQAESCRTRSNVQAAFAGGLALKPAPYGITMISIATLLVPFFFPGCNATSAPDSTQTANAKAVKASVDSQVKDLQISISAKTTQLLEQYQSANAAFTEYIATK